MSDNPATNTAPITIQRGVPSALTAQVAAIYHEAFRQKLTPVLGADADRARGILCDSIAPENAFIAVRGEQVLGVVGFHHAGKGLIDVRFGRMVAAFGPIGATGRALIGLLLSRSPKRDEFLMDGIAVHADARGQGVGTRLFEAMFAFATAAGYKYVRLEVVDSNPRAQALYERLGFIALKTEALPFLKPLGFTSVTTMQYTLSAD